LTNFAALGWLGFRLPDSHNEMALCEILSFAARFFRPYTRMKLRSLSTDDVSVIITSMTKAYHLVKKCQLVSSTYFVKRPLIFFDWRRLYGQGSNSLTKLKCILKTDSSPKGVVKLLIMVNSFFALRNVQPYKESPHRTLYKRPISVI